MKPSRSKTQYLSPFLRGFPTDLAVVIVWVALTGLAVFLPGIRETPLRFVLGLPFVLFLPGYAFVSMLFPEKAPSTESVAGDADILARNVERLQEGSVSGIVRMAFSFGVSMAIIPFILQVLDLTPWGIRLVPAVVAVSGFTVGCTFVAAQRRRALPESERFSVPVRRWFEAARNDLFRPKTSLDAVLNVFLILSLVLAAVSVGYAVSPPLGGDQFTEFYLLSEGDDGQIVADDYPTEFELGESRPVILGVSNHEHDSVEYTVVVQLQRVEVERNNNQSSVTVVERDELDRFRTELAHNETLQEPYQIEPTMAGDDLRLTFLLYQGEPPDEPTISNAYREVHITVNVTDTPG